MISYATGMTSPFLTDGKDILVSEIGKEYGIYFSILKLISQGKASQSEIDSIILKNTGAYLKNLETALDAVQPHPMMTRPCRNQARPHTGKTRDLLAISLVIAIMSASDKISAGKLQTGWPL